MLDEILDLDGLSVLLRFVEVLSLKRVILLRGTTTPLFLTPLLLLSTLEDFVGSSRLDFRNVFVYKEFSGDK